MVKIGKEKEKKTKQNKTKQTKQNKTKQTNKQTNKHKRQGRKRYTNNPGGRALTLSGTPWCNDNSKKKKFKNSWSAGKLKNR